jgi:hypothetical protein
MITIPRFKFPKRTPRPTTVTLDYTIDNPTKKIIYAHTLEVGRIILWEGAAYDAIGQWTDNDVTNKLKELYPTND